ncbi:MAG: NAD-dependent epimerase/dehydratase family protein [Bacteroidota bacterium]|nr:NAD-dependent epimerase/dehydratase family protein [Candidatus Kapabacteria bacterium]MCS7303235.1 NAD-dependent epimerase/dehydratase family protein [Candidatus Kapabacteria bacterium]MCX7936215.1 NAD-dependent epimerase/dehydratase family protein [Chlorobiota bacterium]MDW8074891.1 NAD-dependent epimerase/dehydratase family protein [Bacteroidota bacterium]MDW8271530.1 NAD-dependent epimerase/dehydratase family protein [Bacteroidota bacterium]
MKVLVTGGAGFIGSHIAELYHACGHEVVVLDNFVTGRKENLPPTIRVVEMDIRDRSVEAFIRREQFDAINHHAALLSVPESFRFPVEYADVNVTGTVNLLEAAVRAGVRVFIFASTCAVYAEDAVQPYTEDSPTAPVNPYGASKLSAEHFINAYAAQHPALRVVVLRYGNVFGPRQRVYGEGNLVAVCAAKLLAQDVPTIFGDGSHTRDFVYVQDVAELNCHVLERPVHGTFNVGTGIARSVLEVYTSVARAVGTERAPRYGPPRVEPAHIVLSPTALMAAIGWQPQVDFDQGIRQTVAWFAVHSTPVQ